MTRNDLEAIKGEIRKQRDERDKLRTEVAEAAQTMRTIANLFSDRLWVLLPPEIKRCFEAYREGGDDSREQ